MGKKTKNQIADEKIKQEIVDLKAENKIQMIDPESLEVHKILPGIHVKFTCVHRGGKTTNQEVLSSEERDGEVIEKTLRTTVVVNQEEEKKADAKRQAIRRAMKKYAVNTDVGLIVPARHKSELAQAISYAYSAMKNFNDQAEHWEVIFRLVRLSSIPADDSGTIGAVTDQLNSILERVNQSALLDEAELLEKHATKGQLGDWKTAKAVLTKATPDERRLIVANVRANMARKAVSEARNFSALLPEEAGLQVTDMVATLRKTASSWLAGAKKDEESYKEALESFDADGVSAMQGALIKAAVAADKKTEKTYQETLGDMPLGAQLISLNDQEKPETIEKASSDNFVGLDLFGDQD